MKATSLVILTSVVVGLLCGCKPKTLPPDAYCKWVENPSNELHQVKSLNGYDITMQYKPAAYIAIKNVGNINTQNKLAIESTKYEGLIHFNLKIQSLTENDIFKNKQFSAEQATSLINYFSYPVQNHIKLIVSKDTLPCVLYHFERSHNMTPYCNMVLGFEVSQKQIKDNIRIWYNDSALGIGNIHFEISHQRIVDIPDLKF